MLLLGHIYFRSKNSVAMLMPLLDLAWVGPSVADLVPGLVEGVASELDVDPSLLRWVRVSDGHFGIRIPADATGVTLGRVLARVRTRGSFFQAEVTSLSGEGTRESMIQYERGRREIRLSRLSKLISTLKPGWDLAIGLEKVESGVTIKE